ncbi:MAG TPA: hypothetical protein VGX97_08020 [bacterium]|nr:hypothetical protein [bacterium]
MLLVENVVAPADVERRLRARHRQRDEREILAAAEARGAREEVEVVPAGQVPHVVPRARQHHVDLLRARKAGQSFAVKGQHGRWRHPSSFAREEDGSCGRDPSALTTAAVVRTLCGKTMKTRVSPVCQPYCICPGRRQPVPAPVLA